MTESGIANRKARLARLLAQASEYADLFETGLDDLKSMVEGTQNALAMAELAEASA
jgi:hypothetical protein